jgi:PHS family inorganic phosphate transporter-like MFS transporter
MVAGIGFFTDAYDLFAIGLVVNMLGVVYFQNPKDKGSVPNDAATAIKAVQSGGTVIGQIGFGIMADLFGRKKMYGLELIIIIFATLAQALSSSSPSVPITAIICFWRVIMGIGIGGDYPLSSIITSEFATTKWRGGMMAAVFAMQGFGQFAAGLIALIVTVGFKDSLESATSYATCTGVCQIAADKMWRVIIGFGAVPGCIALYYRLTIPETPRYTFDVSRDVIKAGSDVKAYISGFHEGFPDEMERIKAIQENKDQISIPQASYKDFYAHYSKWKYFKTLFGCAASWFVLDVAFYGLGLNTPVILASIGYSSSGNVYQRFYNTAVGNLILVCAGAIPGYWFTVGLVDTIGRKPIQLGGFAILTVLFCIIGFDYWGLSTGALFGLYILAEFFLNFGRSQSQLCSSLISQDPMPPPLSCQVNVSQLATDRLRTVFRPPLARLAPSLLSVSSVHLILEARSPVLLAKMPLPGLAMSWPFSPSSC